MELRLIKNDGFTLGERLCCLMQYFVPINRKIACVRCNTETYYDIKELEKYEVNFVEA